jgi:SAM-dependent methyltransferase
MTMHGILNEIKQQLKRLNGGPVKRHWKDSLDEELEYWRDYLTTKGLQWPEEYEMRVNPDSVLEERLIADRLDTIPERSVSILDVGAGPLTILGNKHPERQLEIVPIDPLADGYDRLLMETGVVPPVRTLYCHGEELLSRFKPNTFDFAYARNALDHSYDPLRVIENMLTVVKPGRYVVLRHRPNEAERARYEGLHQWNLDLRGGDLVLWNRSTELSVTQRLAQKAKTDCATYGEWLMVVLTKRES